MIILGIESSCDETASAVVQLTFNNGRPKSRILSNFVASQDEIHSPFGGVVPELASRRHLENSVPIISGALSGAGISPDKLYGIAVTCAPGLMVSLLIGIQVAKGLAFALKKTLIGVNHLEGHLNAILLEREDLPYPHIGLVVSGGHTSLYLVKKFGDYELLGATRDDAAGEAFDKVAKLLNLGYPGGPIINKLAKNGDPKAFKFSLPKFGGYSQKREADPLDFSFSGIKTAVLLKYKEALSKGKVTDQFVYDLIASFQNSVVSFLCKRVIEAAKKKSAKAIVVSGGVAANTHLREEMAKSCEENGLSCYIPSTKLCTDNAAMIAYVGARYFEMNKKSDMKLNAVANMEIGI